MKRDLFARKKRSLASIAISVAAHGVLAVALAAITFHIPLAAFLPQADRPVEVRVSYVRTPAPRAGDRNGSERKAPKPEPVPLPQITEIPTTIAVPPVTIPTPPPPAAPATLGVPGGTGAAASNVASNPRLGIEPGIPDPRISTQPLTYSIPRTTAAMNDSAIRAAFDEYRDSALASAANPKRAPGDWTWDRDGQKWGWDPNGIHIGKYTIPNAILAALPLKIGPTGNINALTDARMASWTQRDLWEHAQEMSDADFKAAVKRIRERLDREHADAEKQKAAAAAAKKPGGG